MKEFDFIGSENVVNIAFPKKTSLFGCLSIIGVVLIYSPQPTKKFVFIQNIKKLKSF